jgi:DNA-binding NarL/FixJ family response regulator
LTGCIATVRGQQVVLFAFDAEPQPESARGVATLPPAEAAVAELLLAGRSNAQIAANRGVSSGTVAKQVERIYRRFGVHSRAEFAAHPGAARYRRAGHALR